MVKVKVCGITSLKDAEKACSLGADALGFVFARSPRRMTEASVRRITSKIPPYVTLVGVFVDEKLETVKRIAKNCRLDCIQLHGSENRNYCKELKKYYKIIKVIKIGGNCGLSDYYGFKADAFLLDTYCEGLAGGSGRKFDWSLAAKVKRLGTPVILAGGLNPGNIEAAVSKVKPYAVDVSSGVESSPGKKDAGLIKKFIEKARKAS